MQSQKFLAFLEALMTKENQHLVESITLGYLAINENDSGPIASDAGMKMARQKTEKEVNQSGNLAITDDIGEDGLVSRALRRMKKHDKDEDEEEEEKEEKSEEKEEDDEKDKKDKKDDDDSDDDDDDDDDKDDFTKLVKNMKKKIKKLSKDED
jgi:hypothetical protein